MCICPIFMLSIGGILICKFYDQVLICVFMTHAFEYFWFIVDLLVIAYDVLHTVLELFLMFVTVFLLPSPN